MANRKPAAVAVVTCLRCLRALRSLRGRLPGPIGPRWRLRAQAGPGRTVRSVRGRPVRSIRARSVGAGSAGLAVGGRTVALDDPTDVVACADQLEALIAACLTEPEDRP